MHARHVCKLSRSPGGTMQGIERDWTIDSSKGRKVDATRFRVSSALEVRGEREGGV